MVSVNINFQKKDLFLFSAIAIFLVAVGYVVAFGNYAGNEAQINGHSSDEVMVNSSGSLITLQQFVDAESGVTLDGELKITKIGISSNCEDIPGSEDSKACFLNNIFFSQHGTSSFDGGSCWTKRKPDNSIWQLCYVVEVANDEVTCGASCIS